MIPAIIIPAWPRALTRDQACAYASASPGNLPKPSYVEGKSPRWLREDLDAWIDRKAGRSGTLDEWLEAAG